MDKKFTKSIKINDYEVLTDTGFVDINFLHETIPYVVYDLVLGNGLKLKCADNHIVFIGDTFEERFVKDLKRGDIINYYDEENEINSTVEVVNIVNLGYEEVMYDLELPEDSNNRYYTNGILSHNTLLAKELAKYLFNDKKSLIRVNMNEYADKHTVSRLFGAAPGYTGYEEGGELTNKVKDKPYSVILLDEVEKAHPDVLDAFLQVLDEGFMIDNQGNNIDFRNTIIILTSNIGTKTLKDFGTGIGFSNGNESTPDKIEKILKKELEKALKPEVLNRMGSVVYFNELNKESLKKIIAININEFKDRLGEIGYQVNIADSMIDEIVKTGFDPKYGARELERRFITLVEDEIIDVILSGANEKTTFDVSYTTKTVIKQKVKK